MTEKTEIHSPYDPLILPQVPTRNLSKYYLSLFCVTLSRDILWLIISQNQPTFKINFSILILCTLMIHLKPTIDKNKTNPTFIPSCYLPCKIISSTVFPLTKSLNSIHLLNKRYHKIKKVNPGMDWPCIIKRDINIIQSVTQKVKIILLISKPKKNEMKLRR